MKSPCDHVPSDYLHLRPGEVVVSEISMRVGTVLGSCVAVTLYDPSTHFAAMCHAMLPSARRAQPNTNLPSNAGRYVDTAIHTMLDALAELGLDRTRLEVKLFGGAEVLSRAGAGRTPSVGTANVAMARSVLRQLRLTIRAENVGGQLGRKLIFHTGSGRVQHRMLNRWLRSLPT